MFTTKDIMEYVKNYQVSDGSVYTKEKAQKITDEETILRVKAVRLIYNEAKNSYLENQQQFGNTKQKIDYYLLKTMEKFSVHDEVNSYGVNKLIRSILTSQGHYEEMMGGKDLSNSKFSILYGKKKDYGLAYLRLKFREKGFDISDVSLQLDTSEWQKNGVSKVIIDYPMKRHQPDVTKNKEGYSHPEKETLNELEKMKSQAKKDNDEIAYRYASSNIERIVKENPIEVTKEQWETFSNQQKESYMKLKIKESKVLKDRDSYQYWQTNLMMLQKESFEHSDGNKKK